VTAAEDAPRTAGQPQTWPAVPGAIRPQPDTSIRVEQPMLLSVMLDLTVHLAVVVGTLLG
jgi:hypothetical protein